MALFLDSASIDELRSAMELGIFAGVTTNPSLLAAIPKSSQIDHLNEIAVACQKTIFLQVKSATAKEMEEQALKLAQVAPGRTVIKIPMSAEGLQACVALTGHSIPVCMTALFSPLQTFSAACAGAQFAAIFVGRIDKRGENGLQVVQKSAQILQANKLDTRVLAASIPDEKTFEALLAIPGIDVTIPFRLHECLIQHPGTEAAAESFSTTR